MSKIALFAAAFVGLAATAAFAQSSPQPAPAPGATPAPSATAPAAPAAPAASTPAGQNVRQVCAKEIRTVCGPSPKGDKTAREPRRQCVEANKAKFSAECQAAIDVRIADRQARKDARKSGAAEKPKI